MQPENQKKNTSFMPKTMVTILIVSAFLCCLFAVLYALVKQKWMFSCAITFGVIAYHFLVRFLSPVLILAFSHKKYDAHSFWFREKAWEAGLYRFLHVRKWKEKTSLLTYDPREFSSELHTLPEIVNNMCHAELVHELIVVFSLLSILFTIPFGDFWVFLITALLASLMDLQFVILQRYNRPRVMKLMKRNIAQKEITKQ